MQTEAQFTQDAALAAATGIVKEMLAKNPGMTAADALALLADVHAKMLAVAGAAAQAVEAVAARPEPAVPVEASVTDDYIVCLEDGTKHQMMKRYLKRVYNMSPEEYRARWNLPSDYPMTAPGYSARKRAEALAVGLGTAENKAGRNLGRALVAA